MNTCIEHKDPSPCFPQMAGEAWKRQRTGTEASTWAQLHGFSAVVVAACANFIHFGRGLTKSHLGRMQDQKGVSCQSFNQVAKQR